MQHACNVCLSEVGAPVKHAMLALSCHRHAVPIPGGRSLLFVLPSERGAMLEQLAAARVPLKPLRVNPGRSQPVGPALQALLSKNAELKVCGADCQLSALIPCHCIRPPRSM